VARCLLGTHAVSMQSTGSPYHPAGTTIAWQTIVPDNCAPIAIQLNGQTVARGGSQVVNPTYTTMYTLRARYGTQTRNLANAAAVGGRVLTYTRSGRGGLVPTSSGVGVPQAAAMAHDVLRSLSEEARKRLVGKALEIHVIPHNLKLTGLPGFTDLRGRSTCEGRPTCVDERTWDDVRGAGGRDIGNNRIAVVAGAETLTSTPRAHDHAFGHVLVHEIGHAVLTFATSDALKEAARTVLQQRGPNADYLGRDAYTKWNEEEYWAEGTAALFGYEYRADYVDQYTEQWLAANDLPLLNLLRGVYTKR
jgi:hypothetical protein